MSGSRPIDDLETALGRLFDQNPRPPDPPGEALGRLIDRLAADPDVRRDLLAVVHFVAERLGRPGTPPPPASVPRGEAETPPRPAEVPADRGPAADPAPPLAAPPVREPLRPLTLGQPRAPEPYRGPAGAAIESEASEVVDAEGFAEFHVDQCALKAEGARWAVERARLLDAGADPREAIEPRDRLLLDRATEGEMCRLWMLESPFDPRPVAHDLERLATCFEATGRAVRLTRLVLQGEPATVEAQLLPALERLAEANSALRVAVLHAGGRDDDLQSRIHRGLRRITDTRSVYIRRFMRLEDPADPGRAPALIAEIDRLSERIAGQRDAEKGRKKAVGNLRHHARLLAEGRGEPHSWDRVSQAIDDLIRMGVAPSSPDFREPLLPLLDDLPAGRDEGLPRGLTLVARALDDHLAEQPRRAAPRDPAWIQDPEVIAVRELLRGRAVVLIGGQVRPDAADALKEAFALDELDWIATRDHQSIERFAGNVSRPSVALVLLAIRWSSHSFGDVIAFCNAHGKPLVRLPGGYNPIQVAHQILVQGSDRIAVEVSDEA